jgi:hypothetical protein
VAVVGKLRRLATAITVKTVNCPALITDFLGVDAPADLPVDFFLTALLNLTPY